MFRYSHAVWCRTCGFIRFWICRCPERANTRHWCNCAEDLD